MARVFLTGWGSQGGGRFGAWVFFVEGNTTCTHGSTRFCSSSIPSMRAQVGASASGEGSHWLGRQEHRVHRRQRCCLGPCHRRACIVHSVPPMCNLFFPNESKLSFSSLYPSSIEG